MDTGQVASSAITVSGIYSNDNAINLDTSEQEIGTITITSNGGGAIISAKCNIVGSTAVLVTMRIRKDSTSGTVLDVANCISTSSADPAGSGVTVPLIGYDASPSGSQVYKLTAQAVTGTPQAQYRRLLATNLKK